MAPFLPFFFFFFFDTVRSSEQHSASRAQDFIFVLRLALQIARLPLLILEGSFFAPGPCVRAPIEVGSLLATWATRGVPRSRPNGPATMAKIITSSTRTDCFAKRAILFAKRGRVADIDIGEGIIKAAPRGAHLCESPRSDGTAGLNELAASGQRGYSGLLFP